LSTFDESGLDVDAGLSAEFDSAECAGKADCVPRAAKVERKS
jgi:hypothetical protein